MNKNAVYIFTCSRPIKLERLLNDMGLIQKNIAIYVIDDSSEKEIIEVNRKITNIYVNTTYLGAKKFKEFYGLNKENQDSQMLGDKTWNLGIARNFALDHSIFWKYEKVLFIDDDISGVEEKIIENGFSTLTNRCFVSCILSGLADDSIVGNIANEVGVLDNSPKMLSGGFLFLTPTSISHRFYNIYNEDWIMQLLEKEKERMILPYSVLHHADHEVKWSWEQVFFQEPGELIVEGLIANANALSFDHIFWDKILENRIKFIEEIKESSLKVDHQYGYDICDGLQKWLGQWKGQSIINYIEQSKNKYYEHKI